MALTRGRMERPHSPDGDPNAQVRLCEGMRPTPGTRFRPMLTARTTFFDGATADRHRGWPPADRGLRCWVRRPGAAVPYPGVRFFELDQGPTQADKARRLRALNTDLSGLTLAMADFRHDDVAAVLAGHGHDVGQPTLFLCEGVLIYLDPDTIPGFLSRLAACAAPGSRLAASLAVHEEGLPTERVVAAANARRRAGETEPWRTILPRRAQLTLLQRAGWHAERTVDAADLEETVMPGRTLLVRADLG